MNRWFGLGLLLVAFGALAFRALQLDLRPMHNDEAVNALKIRDLWERGTYAYDPDEYHGPALHYATLPFIWLSPARDFSHLSEKTLRLVPVFFGVVLILLLWLVRDGLGAAATLFAAGLTAISPAMIFYSRYFIHEMLLVCFTFLLLAAGWRYTRSRHIGWAVLGGTGLGLMFAAKETFVIAAGAMGLAALLTAFWNRSRAGVVSAGPDRSGAISSFWNTRDLLAALGAAVVVWVILFSSFFTHWSGLLDSLRSYLPWFHRAAGHSPHIHPFSFYLERLVFFHQGRGPVWSEGLILLLAGVGMVAAFTRKGPADTNGSLARFIALYTMILTLAYSAISYKTPWCLLGFLQPMILLAGIGAVAVIRLFTQRSLQLAMSAVLFAAAGHLAWLAYQASYVFESDRGNPYVYAQTVPDLLELVEKVEGLAKIHPQGNQMLIQVMAQQGDYWPLPWYLRRFEHVGWWDHLPNDLSAPVMIVGSKLCASLDEKPNQGWSGLGIYGLRPGIVLQLYVQSDLWRRYLQAVSNQQP